MEYFCVKILLQGKNREVINVYANESGIYNWRRIKYLRTAADELGLTQRKACGGRDFGEGDHC